MENFNRVLIIVFIMVAVTILWAMITQQSRDIDYVSQQIVALQDEVDWLRSDVYMDKSIDQNRYNDLLDAIEEHDTMILWLERLFYSQ